MDELPDLVLFVHGLNYRSTVYKALTSTPLPGVRFETFVYGRRGPTFLFSKKAARELTQRLFEHIHALKASRRYRSFNVFAHSLGTQITLGAMAQYPELELDTVFLAAAIVDPSLKLPYQRPKTLFINYVSDDDLWLYLLKYAAPAFNLIGILPVKVGSAGNLGFTQMSPSVINRVAPRSGHESARNPARLNSDVESLLPGRPRRHVLQDVMRRRDAVLRETLIPSATGWRHHSIIPKGLQRIAHLSTRAPDEPVSDLPVHTWLDKRGLIFVEGDAGSGKTTAMLSLYSKLVDDLVANKSTYLPVWISWGRAAGLDDAASILASARKDLVAVGDAVQVFVDGIDERETSSEDWKAIRGWSNLEGVAAVWVAGRTERALESIPAAIRRGFSEHLTVLGFDEGEARAFLLSPTGGPSATNSELVDKIMGLQIVRTGAHYNPLRLLMARLIYDARQEPDLARLEDPYRFYSAYVTLALDRIDVGDSINLQRAQAAAGALGVFHQLRTVALDDAVELEQSLEQLWVLGGQLLERFDVLIWRPELRKTKFKHATFAEYFFVVATVDGIDLDINRKLFDVLLRTPVHHTLAGFVKGKLAALLPQRRVALAQELGRTARDILGRLDTQAAPADTQRLNGVIYLASRLGEGAYNLIEQLWHARREDILRASPEAFVTLLSGISVLGMMSLENEYMTFAQGRLEVLRVLVGWHLVYYGDREKPSDLNFARDRVIFGPDRSWSRTREVLCERMFSSDPREAFLFGFHVLAYLSCAALLSPDELPEATHFVRERLNERNLSPERYKALQDLLSNTAPL